MQTDHACRNTITFDPEVLGLSVLHHLDSGLQMLHSGLNARRSTLWPCLQVVLRTACSAGLIVSIPRQILVLNASRQDVANLPQPMIRCYEHDCPPCYADLVPQEEV
jgi:hypothetical protein